MMPEYEDDLERLITMRESESSRRGRPANGVPAQIIAGWLGMIAFWVMCLAVISLGFGAIVWIWRWILA